MDTTTARTAALASYPTHDTPKTVWPFAMTSGTGLPVAGVAVITVEDQRPRNAKLGRPPRGELR